MLIAYLAALGAAFTFSIAPLIAIGPARAMGALAFNRIRMPVVFLILAGLSVFYGGWQTIRAEDILPLSVSGLVGIFIGDTALFAGLRRLGPRRNTILFASNAPISAMLGYFFLSEFLSPWALLGCALVLSGVIMSIVFGKRREQIHHWEAIQGNAAFGIIIGLAAGFCQAAGAIIAKPALMAGADPIAASAIRVGIASLCLLATFLIPGNRFKSSVALTPSLFASISISGFIGMGIGMSLLLYALAYESTGIIMTLSATTPVMILPLLWLMTRERPALGALAGAALALCGTGLIFSI